MKKRTLTVYISLALGAAAIGAAVTAPAEVIDNLAFFSDFELLSNLEILEEEPAGNAKAPASAAAEAVAVSSGTVRVSTVAAGGL